MQLLLDTHALIWWLANNPTISNKAKDAIALPSFLKLFKNILAINLHIHVSLVIVVKTGKSHVI